LELGDEIMLDYKQKTAILEGSVGKNSMGGVPVKRCRFPMVDGVQSKVTVSSNVDGMFMNIGFVKDLDNTINGNVADALMDRYPGMFDVRRVNGHKIQNQIVDEKDKLKSEILDEIQKDFELVKKKSKVKSDAKPTKRDRK